MLGYAQHDFVMRREKNRREKQDNSLAEKLRHS
jgi:hypothetical protein